MLAKWEIEKLEGYVFGEDKNLYRLPYTHKLRSYGVRKIKIQYPNRYMIGNKWLSTRQMKRRIHLIKKPFVLFSEKEMPF